jgi:hypothetical protein
MSKNLVELMAKDEWMHECPECGSRATKGYVAHTGECSRQGEFIPVGMKPFGKRRRVARTEGGGK